MEATTERTTMEAALDAAKRIAGGNVGLARGIGGITSQAVSQWRIVPPKHVATIEALTGVARHELRPDIFPPVSQSSEAAQ